MSNSNNNNWLDNLQELTRFKKEMVNKTKYYQNQYGFGMKEKDGRTWDNDEDAFRHAFMQADLARKWGNPFTEALGTGHEIEGSLGHQSKGAENMDLWNNKQGREIAREIKEQYFPNKDYEKHLGKNWDDLIAKKVMERMNEGKLITNPNDKRQYKEKKPWFAGKNFSTGQAAPIDANGKFDDTEGHWVTMNGAHVFIKD